MVKTKKGKASLERELINIFDSKEVKEYYVKLKKNIGRTLINKSFNFQLAQGVGVKVCKNQLNFNVS